MPGSVDYYAIKQRDARLEVVEHEIGCTYGAYRPAEADTSTPRRGQI